MHTSPAVASHRHLDSLCAMIGHTPMLEIHYAYRGRERRIYAKYESMNMTGSTKDRMAAFILKDAYDAGRIKPGDTIAEATSGNTGISFSALGRALGHPVRIYMPDWMSQERVSLIQGFGAEIIPVSREQGGFLGSIAMAEDYAASHSGVFLPQQFENPANAAAHERTTGPEILSQLGRFGHKPAAFVAGVGTGGTVMGVGRALRAAHPGTRVHPLEPTNSPTMSTGHKVGKHRIQGISDEFIPAIVKLDELDAIISVWDGDAIIMAQRLATELGLGVGISSGGNFLGALKLVEELGDDGAVVTVFADSNKKYLSTDLCRREPLQDDFLAPAVELLGFRSVR